MSLSDLGIKREKPRDKPFKLFDGGGLYLLTNPNGSRWWRLKYRFAGKERLLGLGTYPEVSLKEARDRREVARRQLRDGIDPVAAKRADKAARIDRSENSFERVAREWFSKKAGIWEDKGGQRILRRLEIYVLPRIGSRPIRDLKGPDLLDLLQRIEAKGHPETAHRVRQYLGAIFRYAIATHRADHDPSSSLKGALAPVPSGSFASVTEPEKVGQLLRAIRAYPGSDAVRCALQLLPLVFVRPGELRGARWEEFSFDLAEPAPGQPVQHPDPQWRIPAARMKMREQHLVPLSRQAVAVLRELHDVTGPDGHLFPSTRSRARPMSDNTLNAALRSLGYSKEQATSHGFRHMASTLLHELGFRSEWIERQLAHADRNSIRSRYNYADYLAERRKMMQTWADYLDELANENRPPLQEGHAISGSPV